ncbi:MAG: FHA domain-containing protein [Oscillospiraceae bacterium]|nr:FHA domain-containing protein [Oscillospiraceae bacterium]
MDLGLIVALGCIVLAVVLIVVAVVILVVSLRKKPEKNVQKTVKSGGYVASNDERTEVVRQPASNGITYELRLISLNSLNKTWTLNVSGEILAGRSEYASLRFEDKSVSREQFRIISTASGLAVVHCGSTNKTMVNDQFAEKPVLINGGDVIKFGREAVRVDYVQPYNPQPYQQPVYDSGWQQPTITETQHWVRH